MSRKTVLVYSKSPLARDERVQRQIRLFAKDHDVISVGLGPYDGPVARHIDLQALPALAPASASAAPAAEHTTVTYKLKPNDLQRRASKISFRNLQPALQSHDARVTTSPALAATAVETAERVLMAPAEDTPTPAQMLVEVLRREGVIIAALRVLRKILPGSTFASTTTAIDIAKNARRQKKIARAEKKRAKVAAKKQRQMQRLLAYRTRQSAEQAIDSPLDKRSALDGKSSPNTHPDPRTNSNESPVDSVRLELPIPPMLWRDDLEAARKNVSRKEKTFFEQLRSEFAREDAIEIEKTHAPIIELLSDIHFDLAIANDLSSINVVVPLAKAKRARVIYDAHEFSPGQLVLNDKTAWNLTLAAYKLGVYLPQCDEVLTVCDASSDEHVKWFGIRRPTTITNAPKYADLTPTALDGDRIRLVHHGVAGRPRALEYMIDTVLLLDDRFSLDFFVLTPDLEYFEELQARCRGCERIRFMPTVPSSKIAESTNAYDMGFFLLPPINFNQTYALPNKFFEFVQARLGVAIGPSPEMASYVRRYDLGVVANAFSPASMAEALAKITPEELWRYKTNAHLHAPALSGEPQMTRLQTVAERVMSTTEG